MDLTGDDCKYDIDKSKIWINCCGFILITQERNTLVNGGELSDRIINAACAVLKKQFPDLGGLQSTLLQQKNCEQFNSVSSDRLSRLIVKQPYSTEELKEIKLTVPQAEDNIQLGDLCAFNNKHNWMIGRVVQFAYYKETLKGSRQYKSTKASSDSSSIGVLCSWFQQQENDFNISTESSINFSYIPITRYICTLSLGCTDIIEGSTKTETCVSQVPMTLYTSHFRLRLETVEAINLRGLESNMKQNNSFIWKEPLGSNFDNRL